MIDDIELIRRFRNEPFEPNPEILQDAREQLAAAMLREQLGEAVPSRSIGELSVIDSMPPRSRHRRRTTAVAICSVAAVVVALVAYVATPKSAIRGGSVAPASTQHWQLAGYVQADWQPNPSGPTSGLMTCPAAGVCYIVDGDPLATPADEVNVGYPSHLLVSMDDGATWTEVDPVGVTSFTTALVCPHGNGDDCVAGGIQGNDPVLLASADGGVTWTGRALPSGAGHLIDLSCTSLTDCVGVMTTNENVFTPGGGQVFTTEDGGSSWSPSNTGGALLQLLACSGTTCIGSGTLPASTPGLEPATINLYSHDSGITWKQAVVPSGFGFLDSSSESMECADTSRCLGIGGVQSNPREPDANAVVESSDGGATWRSVPTLANYAAMAISCATAQDCWIAGGGRADPGASSSPITYQPGEAAPVPATSPVIFATPDGGQTWSKITVPRPQQVPEGTSVSSLAVIGQISCPTVAVCVGLGSGDLSTEHTATYTNAPVGQVG
jgi:photosystem II stability/assembly factor-like uncharacterized protein